MRKDDNISLLLSIIINSLIVFLIPKLAIDEYENQKIKVGLVAYETKENKRLQGEKNSNLDYEKINDGFENTQKSEKKEEKNMETDKKEDNSQKKEEITKVEEKVEIKPKKEEIKKEVEKQTETIEVKNEVKEVKVEKKEKPKAVDKKELKSISENILTPDINILSQSESNLKKNINQKKVETQNSSVVVSNAGKSSGEQNNEAGGKNLPLGNEDKILYNQERGDDNKIDRVMSFSENVVEGLPSGYLLGVEDGDVMAKWDERNKEPNYPESAQKKGLHGSVKLRLSIDENGNVVALNFEKGSGVPEINSAIEEVGRTWKIYLNKNGLNVKGTVILEYKFILSGKNS